MAKVVLAAILFTVAVASAQALRGPGAGQGPLLPRSRNDKKTAIQTFNKRFDIDKEERPRNSRESEEDESLTKKKTRVDQSKVRGKTSPKSESYDDSSESDKDNGIVGRIDHNPVASQCLPLTEKFLSFGDLTFEGDIDIPAAQAALCYSLNRLYTELCSPGFLKCLSATITPLDETPLGGEEPGTTRRLQTKTYQYTAVTRCGRTCQRNRRISGGQTSRHLNDMDNHRMLVGDFTSEYIDLCICPGLPEGSDDRNRALNEEELLPSPSEIVAAFNDRVDSLNLNFNLISFAEDLPDESCDRSDTVEERISVEAALTDCSDRELEENFCVALIASFNKLSADVCDPLFSAIEECELISFESDDRPVEGSNRVLRKLATRRGRYAYNTRTRRRNRRIVGQTSGRRLLEEEQVESMAYDGFPFEERLLSNSIEQCTCVSDSEEPSFEPVTTEAWTAQLQLELNTLCAEAEVQEIEIEGYPVPCEGSETDINVCPTQFMVSVDAIGLSNSEDLANFFLEVYLQLTEGKCGDYLNRSINPINIVAEEEESGVWRVILQFGCVGSCEILPGQPSIFDSPGTVLLPCEETECLDAPRAPTEEEFLSKWNNINTGDWSGIPDILGLVAVKEAASCEVAMCSNSAVNNDSCQEFGFDGAIPFSEIVPCDFPCFDEEFGPDPFCCFRVPSESPSSIPSAMPSREPSSIPSLDPSTMPSSLPSTVPSAGPSSNPTSVPSSKPSSVPSETPTLQPSLDPSNGPSSTPSDKPSTMPSNQPTKNPTNAPTPVPTKDLKGSNSNRRKARGRVDENFRFEDRSDDVSDDASDDDKSEGE